MNPLAYHHNEWKSLLDVSGPFLSLPVLLEVFPSGLEVIESSVTSNLRSAYEEWLNDRDDVAIHSAWIDYVLDNLLGYPKNLLLRGQAIPQSLSTYIPHQALTLRPQLVLSDPSNNQPRLLIQKYHHTQKLDRPPYSESSMSCLTRMMELLHSTQVPLGLITNGEEWVLVHAPVGETSSYISFFSHLWLSETLTLRAFFSLLKLTRFFGVPDNETLPELFKRSAENQHEITDQLGSQVRSSVQILVQAFDKADQDANRKLLKDLTPDSLYEAALTVMMRLVFLLYAEERELLPINELIYNQNYAISTLSDQLRSESDRLGEEILERHYDAWSRILSTSRLVYSGVRHDRLNMPAYGGSLFDPDRFAFLEGRTQGSEWLTGEAKPLLIDNRTVLHILDSIQYLYIRDYGQRQRLSFRALDIEQIGHIYEGLLEYKAFRTEEIMLGLTGNKDYPLPFIALSELDKWQLRGPEEFSKQLKELTGKSIASVKKTLEKQVDIELINRLQNACNHQDGLYQRVLPFAGLLGEDDYGNLLIIQSGSVYVSRGTTRRATGTHYTPRSLTEPIVQHTLEPIIYIGPAEGLPEEQWTLRPSAELLNLKICDIAMGSGSFLVQVIRYLSERLIESWQKLVPLVDPGQEVQRLVTPEGKILGSPTGDELPNDLDARYLLARRLIADRCIYGVDRNPLAVEMSKLSIWLITLDKNRPFTFLDHALKCGDSLVGVDEQDFLTWARSRVNTTTWSLFDEQIREELEDARSKRKELEAFQVRDMTDLALKEDLLQQADHAARRIKLGCDLLAGARLQGLSEKETESEEGFLLWQWTAGETEGNHRCQVALKASNVVRAFHWFLEFPEVFEKGGFSAIVGNPPFMGGKKISTEYGMNYQEFIKKSKTITKGAADLCAYFFLSGYLLLKHSGILGLIATNTIAQADTREVGLDYIEKQGGTIIRANNNLPWPGSAAVVIDVIHIVRGNYRGKLTLDNKSAVFISAFLDDTPNIGNPFRLTQNANKSFIGTLVNGIGFVVSEDEAKSLIDRNPKNKDVLLPFLTGQDLNTKPDQSPDRWIICFFDWPIENAEQYPECLSIVNEKVKPFRDKVVANGKQIHEYAYWKYWDKRPYLYNEISTLTSVLVISRVTKYVAFSFQNSQMVFSDAVVVFASQDFNFFTLLSSSFHNDWAWKYSSTMGSVTLRYSPTDAFETFPFPNSITNLEKIGKKYYEFRKQLMVISQFGLTTSLNIFHSSEELSADIVNLRGLQVEIDNAVAAAYGWNDLDLDHGFYKTPQGVRFTISESARREVLSRLLQLNHRRHEEEVRAGLVPPDPKDKSKPSASSRPKTKKQTKSAQPIFQSVGQIDLGLKLDALPEPRLEIEPRLEGALSIDQLDRWTWYRCASCGATVMGFGAKDHILEKHGNVDVGFLKPNIK